MSESKHTPGPWEVLWQSTIIAGDMCIAIVGDTGLREPAYKQRVANVRLIAAAPELLEALEMVRDADDDCRKDGLPTIPTTARNKIDAAIAKAKGQA